MKQLRKPFILGLLLVLICLAPLHAQTSTQAPDDATKKISDLVHAGKYADAQQLTNGLLIAYPNDQRLIKAKGIIYDPCACRSHCITCVQRSDSSARINCRPTHRHG